VKTYTVQEIKEILDVHDKWLHDEDGGERADLQGADLRGADLRGADLQGADLRRADLRGADLQGADLRRADLRGADLQGADLRRAYLRGADLQGADLRRAYLRGADLQGADLQGADLRRAYLRGADLQGAKYADEEMLVEYFCIGPMGSRSDYLQVFITDKRVELKTGCFGGSLEQFTEQASKHIIAEHRQSYLAAVEFIKAMVAPKAA